MKAEIQRLLCGSDPMPSAELERKAAEATGCHANTIKSAKKDSGVGSYQPGQKRHFVLPSQSAINRERG